MGLWQANCGRLLQGGWAPPQGVRICLALRSCLGLRALCRRWVSHLPWAHALPSVLRPGAGGRGGGAGPPAALQPLSFPPPASLTPSLCNAGDRAPASLGKRARPGWAARGVSRNPTTPTPSAVFHRLLPLSLCPLSLGLPPIFRAGKKHERTSSSPPYQRRHHDLPSHPLNPQPLPWVLTPEGLEKRLTRKSALGSF